MIFVILSIGFAYFLGSISFAVIISKKLCGKDIRTLGSGNAGATNVLRSAGKKAALWVFLGDFAKGLLAVTAVRALVYFFDAPDECIYLAGFFVQLGHCFPIFFRFKGGKGVATAAGAAMGIMPAVGAVLIALFAVIALVTKTASVASCICASVYPLLAFFSAKSTAGFVFSAACSVLIIIMHRSNIARLLDGEEKTISG